MDRSDDDNKEPRGEGLNPDEVLRYMGDDEPVEDVGSEHGPPGEYMVESVGGAEGERAKKMVKMPSVFIHLAAATAKYDGPTYSVLETYSIFMKKLYQLGQCLPKGFDAEKVVEEFQAQFTDWILMNEDIADFKYDMGKSNREFLEALLKDEEDVDEDTGTDATQDKESPPEEEIDWDAIGARPAPSSAQRRRERNTMLKNSRKQLRELKSFTNAYLEKAFAEGQKTEEAEETGQSVSSESKETEVDEEKRERGEKVKPVDESALPTDTETKSKPSSNYVKEKEEKERGEKLEQVEETALPMDTESTSDSAWKVVGAKKEKEKKIMEDQPMKTPIKPDSVQKYSTYSRPSYSDQKHVDNEKRKMKPNSSNKSTPPTNTRTAWGSHQPREQKKIVAEEKATVEKSAETGRKATNLSKPETTTRQQQPQPVHHRAGNPWNQQQQQSEKEGDKVPGRPAENVQPIPFQAGDTTTSELSGKVDKKKSPEEATGRGQKVNGKGINQNNNKSGSARSTAQEKSRMEKKRKSIDGGEKKKEEVNKKEGEPETLQQGDDQRNAPVPHGSAMNGNPYPQQQQPYPGGYFNQQPIPFPPTLPPPPGYMRQQMSNQFMNQSLPIPHHHSAPLNQTIGGFPSTHDSSFNGSFNQSFQQDKLMNQSFASFAVSNNQYAGNRSFGNSNASFHQPQQQHFQQFQHPMMQQQQFARPPPQLPSVNISLPQLPSVNISLPQNAPQYQMQQPIQLRLPVMPPFNQNQPQFPQFNQSQFQQQHQMNNYQYGQPSMPLASSLQQGPPTVVPHFGMPYNTGAPLSNPPLPNNVAAAPPPGLGPQIDLDSTMNNEHNRILDLINTARTTAEEKIGEYEASVSADILRHRGFVGRFLRQAQQEADQMNFGLANSHIERVKNYIGNLGKDNHLEKEEKEKE